MAHANKRYKPNTAAALKWFSAFPDGPPAPTGSNIAISGSVSHGSACYLFAGPNVNFGAKGPDFVYTLDLKNATANTNFELAGNFFEGYISNGIHYTSAERFPIKTIAGLPYNIGRCIGDLQLNNRDTYPGGLFPIIEVVVKRPSEKSYKFQMQVWPAANQANQLADHAGGEQVKDDWDMWSASGNLTSLENVNVYTSLYGTTDDGSVMEAFGALAKSNGTNFTPNAQVPSPGENLTHVYIDSTHQRSNVLTSEILIVSQSPTNSAWTRILDQVDGEICNVTRTVDHPVGNINNRFDRTKNTGNAQGMNVPQNKNYYSSMTFKQYGDFAERRVMISRNSTYTTGDKDMSICIPQGWSNKVLRVVPLEGPFWQEGLSGKYLLPMSGVTTSIGSAQIP